VAVAPALADGGQRGRPRVSGGIASRGGVENVVGPAIATVLPMYDVNVGTRRHVPTRVTFAALFAVNVGHPPGA
jgi:hypothetical protein